MTLELSVDASAQARLAGWVRAGLARFAAQSVDDPGPALRRLLEDTQEGADFEPLGQQVAAAVSAERGPLALAARALQLDPAELFLVGLAGEVESDHLAGLALSELQGGGSRPAVHTAVAMVAELFGAGLDAIALLGCAPVAAHLLELRGDGPVPQRELAVDARLWAALRGGALEWPACRPIDTQEGELVPELTAGALPYIAALMRSGGAGTAVLRGTPRSGRAGAAALLAGHLGRRALRVPLDLWRSAPALGAACRWAGWLPVLELRVGAGESCGELDNPGYAGPLALLVGGDGLVDRRDTVELELGVPEPWEREKLWRQRLGDTEFSEEAALAALGGPAIVAIAGQARVLAGRAGEPLGRAHLRAARRLVGADSLRLLAQPVDRRVLREQLVCTPPVMRELDQFVLRCRAREKLWLGLGGATSATSTRGVRALFVGESGTGKTLAASWLASELGAPLYRVDLSAVMNKYVGESEKNLARLLDLAAAHDVMLLFDEADALFGQRGDGSETGERYANMLTNFLLQRIEEHPGIAVLTSNSRIRIDNAFTRRLDAILEFPLPGAAERMELWRSHLGARSPGDDVCNFLASWSDLPGGAIRNAVVAAASSSEDVIPAARLVEALAREYRKLGRAMPAALGGL